MIDIILSGSKSITNRLLVLNALFKNKIQLNNVSQSQDSQLMNKALSSNGKIIDIHHAGTAMRFLTAYYSIQEGKEIILTGSGRMKERPILILVNALKELGADIQYLENEGYPPLKIGGKQINKDTVTLSANISSQYITALCLIGSKLKNGLNIKLEGKTTSLPYINMSLDLLNKLGVPSSFNTENNTISISAVTELESQEYTIESDWSSASYHYSLCALGKELKIHLKYLFENSLQADRRVVEIYNQYFGVKTFFNNGEVILTKDLNFIYPDFIELDMNDCPDIAQTIAVTALGLQIPIRITGLETLKIKETDRLLALKNELEKCGGNVVVTEDTFELKSVEHFIENAKIKTYNDHRMAMSFAPLQLLFPLEIEHPEVVEKSYTEFWGDMKKYNIAYSSIKINL